MDKKQSALGSYPAHWGLVTFDTVAELKHGYQFRTTDFTSSGVKVFKITQIRNDGVIDISSCDYIDASRLNDFTKNIIQKGDILMALTGATIGKIARYKENEVVLQNYRVGNFLPLDENVLSKDYFYYFLTSNYTFQQILANQTQSAQQNVGKEDIHKMILFLPPLPEQKAIAELLTSVDDKIDLLQNQIATLEKMAETLFKQWLEVKENNGSISQLIQLQNGYAFKSKDFKESGLNGVIKIKNISGGIIDINRTDYIDETVALGIREDFSIKSGDILIAMTGAEIGKLGIIPKTSKKLWLNQRVGLLKENYKGAKYLAYLQLKSEYGQDYIENAATGSAQPNISGSSIENCGFPILSEEEIKEYSIQIGELYDKVIFNLGQISTLKTIKNNLLPKILNGDVSIEI